MTQPTMLMLNGLSALSVDYGPIGNVMVKVNQRQIMFAQFAPQLNKFDIYRYIWTITSYKVCISM